MSEFAIPQQRSADILTFRARPVAAPTDAPPRPGPAVKPTELFPAPQEPETDPALRLRTALASLEAALAVQRTALADWRGALTELHGSLGGLGSSMQSYNAALGGLAQGVTRLNQQARTLEATADAALRRPGALDISL
jgi:hypothetical protein